MGRVTLAVRLKYEANREGEQIVRIRITKDRQSVFWALNLSLPEKYFNENGTRQLKNWVRKNYPDQKAYNERIDNSLKKAETAVEFFEKRDIDYSASDIRAYIEQGGYADRLLSFFVGHIQERKRLAGNDLSKVTTADGYVQTLKVLRWFLRAEHALSDSVTDEQIDARYWMLSKFTKKDVLALRAWMEKQYAENSITTHLGNLRHVLYQAAEAGLISYEKFPMRGVTLAVRRKKVQRLHEEEIEMLATTPEVLKHKGGHPAVTDPRHARSLALLMYLAHGARLSDALSWRVANYRIDKDQHRLFYTTGKNNKDMSVLLTEEAIALIEPLLIDQAGKTKPATAFLFPYLPSNFDTLTPDEQFLALRRAKNRARQQIVRLGSRIGLTKHITPHIMRHSFADMMRRAGVPLETRQEALAHSDIKTTRSYEEQFDQDAVDQVSMLYQKRKGKSQDNSGTTMLTDGDENEPSAEPGLSR